ncbi:hypothetical protein [Streptomyces sp. NPDC020747]|uniref:hypothetical protein n=1 Tax=Streptomyces sp. NPDC020747 TaxID=3365086 RepID=UPI003796B87D
MPTTSDLSAAAGPSTVPAPPTLSGLPTVPAPRTASSPFKTSGPAAAADGPEGSEEVFTAGRAVTVVPSR